MKENELTYFGVYHDGDVNHGMVDHLIKAVNEGREYRHDAYALIEQRSHITPNVLKWAFMNHIDMAPDDSHYMGLAFKHCTAWGEDQTGSDAITVGYPDDTETCLCVTSHDVILYGSGDKTRIFTRSFFSLPETRIYLGEAAKARREDYQKEYDILKNSIDSEIRGNQDLICAYVDENGKNDEMKVLLSDPGFGKLPIKHKDVSNEIDQLIAIGAISEGEPRMIKVSLKALNIIDTINGGPGDFESFDAVFKDLGNRAFTISQ